MKAKRGIENVNVMYGSLWQKDASCNQYQITLSTIISMMSTIMSVYAVHGRLYPLMQSNMHLIFQIVEAIHGHPQLIVTKSKARFYIDILIMHELSLQCAHAANSMIASQIGATANP
jgi:hypothetical protein